MDVLKLRAWYRTPMGHAVRRTVQDCINNAWPDLRGERILVLGFGVPYINLWLKEAQVFCGMNARAGSVLWPENAQNRTCLLWYDEMPFADQTFDKILLIHSLEFSDNAHAFMAECQRILKDTGQIMAIVPNRLGAWSRHDETPFGRGLPYSSGQVSRVFRHNGFAVDSLTYALFVPPYDKPWLWRHSSFFEKWGQRLKPPVGGVIVAQAHKDIHAGLVIRSGNFKQVRRIVALPDGV